MSDDDDEPMEEDLRGMYGVGGMGIGGGGHSPLPSDHDASAVPASNYQGAGHQCVVCCKVFLTTKGLVQHSIIHTDKKPFECEICHKAFRFKSNLFEHRSIHSGEQPFVCPYCGKACRLKGNLKKHLKTHVRDPNEIEQAYEAVTSAHASGTPIDSATIGSGGGGGSGNVEYLDDTYHHDGDNNQQYRSTPTTTTTNRLPINRINEKKRRSNAGGGGAAASMRSLVKKHDGDSSSVAAVLIRAMQDENNEPLMQGRASYPPLNEMCGPRYTTEEFFRAARAIPFEKYHCRPCQLTFNCRLDMQDHCENVHDISHRISRKDKNDPIHWCDICLRDFEDQKAYDQHFFFHRRIRALINKGELHVREPDVPSYF